ncbi:hypothetical protein HYV44_03800 [Candidatus Microgenomates bacterium]|nr:hypothetical protein [Candidatus Microgenomates bacterium]
MVESKVKKQTFWHMLLLLGAIVSFFVLPGDVSKGAGQGKITIQINPSVNTTAYIDGAPIPYFVTNGKSSEITLAEGAHYVNLDPVTDLITPMPPTPDSPKATGRKFYLASGENKIISIDYYQPSGLKAIGAYEDEVLRFTPSATIASAQWALVEAVAEITQDKKHWQRSSAEILNIGAVPPVIDIAKTNGMSIIPIGQSGGQVSYDISFFAAGNLPIGSPAIIDDTLTIFSSDGADLAKVNITGAQAISHPLQTVSSFTAKSARFTVANPVVGTTYTFRVTVKIGSSLAINTRVSNKATGSVGGYQDSDTDEDVVASAFIKESAGGSVFGRRGVNLRNPSSTLYIVGSGGNIKAASEQDWLVGSYGVNTKSVSNFGIDEGCRPEDPTGCGVMQSNINKIKKVSKQQTVSVINGELDLNPSKTPEGGVKVFNSGLTIGSALGAPITMKGKGTIIVEGDLIIKDDLIYLDGKKDLAGFIVHNGNIKIAPNVKNISGIFYVYSDKGVSKKGSFISESFGTSYDIPLTIRGAVIASGYSNGTARSDAIQLARNYIGPESDFYTCDKKTGKCTGTIKPDDPSTWKPSEIFDYDARVVFSPPPGFAKEVFKARE